MSGQLEGEAFACALSNIYTFGPTFRAENSNTARHAAEVGLAQAVLSWPGSDDGFLRYASMCITNVLRHLPAVPPGRPHPLSPLIPSSHPRGGRPG